MGDHSRGFRPEIESLRGIAAFTVAFAHCFAIGLHPTPAAFAAGLTVDNVINLAIHLVFDESGAVILFFVISGYVLGLQLDGLRGTAPQQLAEYYIRRVFRIVPAMWAIVIAAFTLKSLAGMTHAYDWDVLFKTLLFQSPVLDSPLWTIIIEMACSLIFPLLYLINRRGGVTLNVTTLVIGYFLMEKAIVPEWMRFIVYFQAGLLVGTAGADIIRNLGRLAPYVAAVSVGVICVLATTCSALGLDGMLWLRGDGVAAFLLLSFIVARPQSTAVQALVSRPARFLGAISYSLYLIHWILIEFTVSHISLIVPASIMKSAITVQAITALICVPASLVLATLCYRWIEKPFIRIGRNIVAALRENASPSGSTRKGRPAVRLVCGETARLSRPRAVCGRPERQLLE